MVDDRWVRVLLALGATDGPAGARLCSMSARVLAVSGAGITLMTDGGPSRTTVCSSDEVAQQIEDLQFTLGEGPCEDAYAEDRPVGEPDLSEGAHPRWPLFSPAARSAGAAAVFGFPLRAAGVRLGAIDLYRDRPGALSAEQHADALVVADVLAREILVLQAGAFAGAVAGELAEEPGQRLVVHQATGMISVQLGVDVREAMVRLRACAYAEGVSVTTVATQVVHRERRFD